VLGTLEIVAIVVIFGGLLLLQAKTRAGSLPLYVTIGILLLILIVTMRFIRSLIGVLIVLALFCVILFWRVLRSK
jgi:hypothetical protein